MLNREYYIIGIFFSIVWIYVPIESTDVTHIMSLENQIPEMGSFQPLKIAVVLGSVRTGRMCTRVSNFVVNELNKRKHEVLLFDPAIHNLPLLQKALHHYRPGEDIPKDLLAYGEKLKTADAFLIISGEYNHSIPPALSNFLDHFGSNVWGFKPSGIITYSAGPIGGARAAMQLRAMLGELGCISVSNILNIGVVGNALEENGTPKDADLPSKLERHLGQVEWMANAMKDARAKYAIPK